MSRMVRLGAVLLPLLTWGATQAAAAPQALGLIARADPVKLQCERGECSAEFTAFCVERYRTSPEPGTAYYVHDPDTLTVEGVREDGTRLALDVAGLMSVSTARGHSAVRLSLPTGALKRYEVASVEVSVGRTVTLIPEPVPGDPYPQTALDIALAAGPLRTAAAVVVDDGGDLVGAALVTASVINTLPRHGRASDATRDRAWGVALPLADTAGYGLARQAFDRCTSVTRAGMESLRQCLGSVHDTFIGELNTRYWHALEIGS